MSLSYMNKLRAHMRTRTTRLCAKADNLQNLSRNEKLTLLSSLKELQLELKKINSSIAVALDDSDLEDSALNEEFDRCDSYDEKILTALSILNVDLETQQLVLQANVASPNENLSQNRLNKLKLPEIPLPKFGNAINETLTNFCLNFESVINKYNLSDYEKFVYLKRQLEGEPLTLINSLSGAKQSYEVAKSLLKEAFADTVAQKYSAISRLAKLSLSSDKEAYGYISEFRLVQDLFESLNISTDEVLQYFIWSGLSVSIQNQLINISNTNKPDLKQIIDNIFKALERCKEISSQSESLLRQAKYRREVQNFAAVVPYEKFSGPSAFCSLCSTGTSKERSHSTKDCPVYPSPRSKFDKLKSIHACIRCGFLNHSIENCSYSFRRNCFTCGGQHMTFLCVSPPKSRSGSSVTAAAVAPVAPDAPTAVSPGTPACAPGNRGKTKNQGKLKVSSGVVWTETVLEANIGSKAILPTFQCQIHNLFIRCLKDTGCQPNFIASHLADQLNLPIVVSDYTVIVNGFNEGKTYNTKVVSVPLKLKSKLFHVNAICVPKISTSLKLPGLRRVAGEFVDKGYELADPKLLLSDCVNDINFVLGMSDPDVLLERQIVFGVPPSVFSETNAGVLIYGTLEKLVKNMSNLPQSYTKRSTSVDPGELKELPNFCSNEARIAHPEIEDVTINSIDVCDQITVLNDNGKIDERALTRATDEILNMHCEKSLGYDTEVFRESSTASNEDIVKYVLNNTERGSNGRLIMPLIWRQDVSKFLGQNNYLSRQILFSLKKMSSEKLSMIDDSIKEWKNSGIVEIVENLPDFLKTNPAHSFLPHMGVFRMNRETTKCRVVFLSNLCEGNSKAPVTMSHNQVIQPGPSLNHKITDALIHLRFGENLLCYDLEKAFLQIQLRPQDCNRLLFYWFKDVKNSDFNIVAYRNLRLSFGLRCSPTLLLLALFKILCLDVEGDSLELKFIKLTLYGLLYMDNGAFLGSAADVERVYYLLPKIFSPYGFKTQQFVTNNVKLQRIIDREYQVETPQVMKLLGVNWHRVTDGLAPRQINLNIEANTKRLILQSVASQYDTFNFQGPCLNRARLFLHSLQTSKNLSWDDDLGSDKKQEWVKICKQANKTVPPEVPRVVGSRDDSYELIAFVDASKQIYASVVYLKNLKTSKCSFLMAKNRIVNKQLAVKTIPSLELQGVTLGVEMLLELKASLDGPNCVLPVKIEKLRLYTDSTISLFWLMAQTQTLSKMQKLSVFVRNRLDYIEKQCNKFPITFAHVNTKSNPADCMTRCFSCSQLQASCYYKGPAFISGRCLQPTDPCITVPNPDFNNYSVPIVDCSIAVPEVNRLDVSKFSSFRKLVNVYSRVLEFVLKLKSKCAAKTNSKFNVPDDLTIRSKATTFLFASDQREHFPELINFSV